MCVLKLRLHPTMEVMCIKVQLHPTMEDLEIVSYFH